MNRILLFLSLFSSCGNSEKKPVTPDEPDTEAVDTDTDMDGTDTGDTDTGKPASNCGNRNLDEGEVCDGGAKECAEIDPAFTGGYAVCESDCSGWNTSGCHSNQDPVDNS